MKIMFLPVKHAPLKKGNMPEKISGRERISSSGISRSASIFGASSVVLREPVLRTSPWGAGMSFFPNSAGMLMKASPSVLSYTFACALSAVTILSIASAGMPAVIFSTAHMKYFTLGFLYKILLDAA